MGGGGSKPKTGRQAKQHKQKQKDGSQYKKYTELLNSNSVAELYEHGRKLGSGNMATVYMYTRRSDGRQFAAKIVEKYTLSRTEDFTNELEILGHLRGHPHILELEDVFEDENAFYLITDLVSGGELFDRICDTGAYTEQIAKELILPMLKAIKFCHDKGVVHRDIKPENLLLLDDSPEAPMKIADFGVAAWEADLAKDRYVRCGTPEYMAPEMWSKNKHSAYDKKVDVWAMGCCIYIMLCGWHPFQNENKARQKIAIVNGDLTELHREPISDLAKDFIRKCLTTNPKHRHGLEQLMQHEWFKENSEKTILADQQKKLKQFQARRRLRKVSFAVLMTTRAQLLAKGPSARITNKEEDKDGTKDETADGTKDGTEDDLIVLKMKSIE